MDESLKRSAITGIFAAVLVIPILTFGILNGLEKLNQNMVSIYLVLTIIYMIGYFIFVWGFKIIGDKTKNRLLTISVYLVMIYSILNHVFEFLPIEKTSLINIITGVVLLVIGGIVTLLFGIALLKLKDKLGPLATTAAVLNIIAGISFITVILSFIALLILIPSIVLEIILMFKAAEKF